MFPSLAGTWVACCLATWQGPGEIPLTIPPPPMGVSTEGAAWAYRGANPRQDFLPGHDPDTLALQAYRSLMLATMAGQQQEATRLKGEMLLNHPASTFTRFLCFQEKWNGLNPAFLAGLAGRATSPAPEELGRLKAALANAYKLVPEPPNAEIVLLSLLLNLPCPSPAASVEKLKGENTATAKAIADLDGASLQPRERIRAMVPNLGHATVRPFAWAIIQHQLSVTERQEPDAALCLAKILMLEQQRGAAISVLEALVADKPSPEAHYLLGSLLLGRGQPGPASASLRQAAAAGHPRSVAAQKLLNAAGKHGSSLDMTREALNQVAPRLTQGASKGIVARATWPASQGGTRQMLARLDPKEELFTLIIRRDDAIDLAVECTPKAMRLVLAGEKEIREYPGTEGMVPAFWLQQAGRNINFQFNTVRPGDGAIARSLAGLAGFPLFVSPDARAQWLAGFQEAGWFPSDARQENGVFRATWLAANALDEHLMEAGVEIDSREGRVGLSMGSKAKVELMVNNQGAMEGEFAKAWPALPGRPCGKLEADVFSRLLGTLMGLGADMQGATGSPAR